MECKFCRNKNLEGSAYCSQCGAKLFLLCLNCGHQNLSDSKFCNNCGNRIEAGNRERYETRTVVSERKYITVLFSDLSGYTALSERLDPERVKEILNIIFNEIAHIVKKYDGYIARIIGDEILAFFGFPKNHEDDPIRAVRTALEIHHKVETMAPLFTHETGQPLRMHTGISTGLVVTGEMNPEKGQEGFAGHTINMASRLTKLAKAGETFVNIDTYSQTREYFHFEEQLPTKVKGISDPIQLFKVLILNKRSNRPSHFKGLRADLAGREAELTRLREAVENLKHGLPAIYAICGEAGMGKSRLMDEFKASLNPEDFSWFESHSYAYSQNIPYSPLIDLINRIFHIEEEESQKQTRHKVETGIKNLLNENGDHACYMGRLYATSGDENDILNPELGKSRLQEALQAVLAALAREKPLIICFEDLHWADSSFLELFRFFLSSFQDPVFFLCTYRPPFSLFGDLKPAPAISEYREIRLQNLATLDAENMVKSLLKTESIPAELHRMIHEKAEGNPFYLEEVVNALIDSETLKRKNGVWELKGSLDFLKIPSKVHGVISARLDHLEKPTKRVLQEASIMGKSFSLNTLEKITRVQSPIAKHLSELEKVDMIRMSISQSGQKEYAFKHSLIQEVVYDGLLIKERQEIHEKTAQTIEQTHLQNLGGFYETLAFHFKRGLSRKKAIHYLMKSGEKSLNKYAVEESHLYFKEAFELQGKQGLNTTEEKTIIIDMLSKWAFVFHYRGDFKGLKKLLSANKHLALDLADPSRLGMFYVLFGLIQYETGMIHESYDWLCKALKIGEEINNHKVIGYACSWLSWTCSELCRFDEAIRFGERAIQIANELNSEDFLFFNSLSGMGKAYWFMGNGEKTFELGATLLSHGQKYSNIRSLALGHFITGCSHLVNGDVPLATQSFQKAIEISADPWYSQFSRMLLGFAYLSDGKLTEAQKALEEVMLYSRQFDADIINTPSRALMGLVSIASGYPAKGLKMLHRSQQEHREKGRKYALVNVEYLIGRLFLLILSGAARQLPLSKRANIFMRIMPFCALKARCYFERSADWAEEIGAQGIKGQAYLDLGTLYLKKGKKTKARKYLSQALLIFKKYNSTTYLYQTGKLLESLDSGPAVQSKSEFRPDVVHNRDV